MIPLEPDPVNTGEGKRRTFSSLRVQSASKAAYTAVNQLLIMAEVYVNQQTYSLPERGTLTDVLILLGIGDAGGIAIAVNEEVIPRAEWGGYLLQERDRVFVIRATQGG